MKTFSIKSVCALKRSMCDQDTKSNMSKELVLKINKLYKHIRTSINSVTVHGVPEFKKSLKSYYI